MSGDMIERVARALYAATPFKETEGGFDAQSETYRKMCRLLARAAIEAMREPTDAMFEAAKPYGLCMSALDDAWCDMIDVALSPAQPIEEK